MSANLPKIFTPYLRPLSDNAYTVVFKSADLQFGYLYNNSGNTGRKIKFSNYALLNLPDIIRPTNDKNNIQLDSIEGTYSNGLSATPGSQGDNIDLVQSLQNYALNMESMLLAQEDYDVTTFQTISERVFFKWLKEIGALRWKVNNSDKSSTNTTTRFDEHDDNADSGDGPLYTQVVKMIGEIDVQGDVYSNFGSKQQIYFYIPSQSGSTPKILFKSVVDDNYYPGQVVRQQDPVNREYIQGSDSSDDPNPSGLTVKAFYDIDVPAGGFVYTVNSASLNSWFDSIYDVSIVDSYVTDAVPEDVTVDRITRKNTNDTNQIEWLRSRLDCVQIDFNKSNYKAFEDDNTLKSFIDFNSGVGSRSFSFNAIAIYYDVIENDQVLATNLYGIVFIGGLSPVSGSGSTFKSLFKQKPDQLLSISGNGYGLILNINRDGNNNNSNTIVNVSINDYNTYSMQLFTQSLLQMGVLSDKFERSLQIVDKAYEKMDEITQLLINDENRDDILIQIREIRDTLGNSTTNAELVDMLSRLNDTVNNILSGRSVVRLDVLFNILCLGGLDAKKDSNGNLIFDDKKEKYSYSGVINLDTDSDQESDNVNVIRLSKKSGLIIHRNDGIPKDMLQHVSIRISEAEMTWTTNQSVKFVIDDIINFNNRVIKIHTGVNGSYSLIGTIAQTKSFEVVCVDPITRDFIIIN